MPIVMHGGRTRRAATTTADTMFDDVNLSLIPANATAVAAYVDGKFQNIAEAKARFPNAHILDIAVNFRDRARCLDDEAGDATNSEAVIWYKAQPKLPAKHVLYTSASNVNPLIATLEQAGTHRSEYLVWSAHFSGIPHICGPHTCGFPQADGTQWTDKALGKSLDESLLSDEFFPAAPPNPDTGVAHATVTVHLQRKLLNIWEVHGTAGPAHFGGKDQWREATIGVNLKTGKWRIHRKGK